MVYDYTQTANPHRERPTGGPGFCIHDGGEALTDEQILIRGSEHRYSLYTDDGRGNGDYICGSSDLYWIRRAAYSMDFVSADTFTYDGLVILASARFTAAAKGAVA